MTTREAVMSALFAKLGTASGIATARRRLALWKDVPLKPALFLCEEGNERFDHQRGRPNKRIIEASIVLYIDAGSDPAAVPATTMNGVLDGIEAAMAVDDFANNAFTLGGLVQDCWISGIPDKIPGDLTGQTIVRLTVNILLP